MENYVRFDWAMKRLLRNKANHAVLEGLMSALLGEKFTILEFLESEANQETPEDKFNRVDILVENIKKELFIVEIQNTRELYYFQRMLYGVSKTIAERIQLGDKYDKVRKIYSINIVYFELGQGKDYVYHGKTIFKGLHDPQDILKLSQRQSEQFFGVAEDDTEHEAGDLFPEYYVLRVNDFDKVATTPLDEWFCFLKDATIKPETKVPGLQEAREILRYDTLSPEERLAYVRHMEAVRHQWSVLTTGVEEGREEGLKEGLKEGHAQGLAEGIVQGKIAGRTEAKLAVAKLMLSNGESIEKVRIYTGLTDDELKELS
jgi:predicted transposase/invertase (TIGR01784 family)